jgi:selT/selW/selH-like putative selenoprotein
VAEINGTAHSAEMIGGESGQFDIFVDDELVFSKRREGRWPELSEILAALP